MSAKPAHKRAICTMAIEVVEMVRAFFDDALTLGDLRQVLRDYDRVARRVKQSKR